VTTTCADPSTIGETDVHGHDHDHGVSSCCGERGHAVTAMAQAMVADLRAGSATGDGPGSPVADVRTMNRTTLDLLVVGPVSTGDPAQPHVGALGVVDGHITALGSPEELDALRGTGTEVLDAGDAVIIPGLIEPHMHLWSTAVFRGFTDCSYASNPTLGDVLDRLRGAVASTPRGAWLCGELFDPSRLPGEPDLTCDLLDGVSTEIPIAVFNASMHFAYVNSAALIAAGITVDTPDPANGKYYRANGRLTGVIGELDGMMAVITAMPQKTPEQLAVALRQIMAEAAVKGVTSMREAMTGHLLGAGEISLLHQLNGVDPFPTRLSLAVSGLLGNDMWAGAGITPGVGDDMVRADAWKVMADGSTQGRSAFLRSDYLGGMGGNGAANFSVDELTALLREGHEAGWQIMVHANGDAGIDRTLSAYERVLAGAPAHDQRHRIEHVAVGHDEHFARMAAIGVSPSFLNAHIYYWGKALRDSILGPERAGRLHRVATALSHGLRPSLHSDYNVSPIHPLLSARTAVLRQTQDDGAVLGPDERIPASAALTAITRDAAWQIHADDRGVLRIGAKADFAVASADPWTTDPEVWPEITFRETRLGGRVAWQA